LEILLTFDEFMIEESMKFWEDEVSRRSGKKMKSPVLLKEKELNGLHLKFQTLNLHL